MSQAWEDTISRALLELGKSPEKELGKYSKLDKESQLLLERALETASRDTEIRASYAAGAKLGKIVREYNLTIYHARRIIGSDIRTQSEQIALQEKIKTEQLTSRADQILQMYLTGMHSTQNIVEELQLSCPAGVLYKWVLENTTREERLTRHRSDMIWLGQKKIPEKEMLQSLEQCALDLGRTPGSEAYDKWLGVRRAQTMIKKFGSWRQACVEAGLDPNVRAAWDGWGTKKYSDTDLVSAVQRVQDIVEHPPTIAEYREHCLDTDPGELCIRNRLGGWTPMLKKYCN